MAANAKIGFNSRRLHHTVFESIDIWGQIGDNSDF